MNPKQELEVFINERTRELEVYSLRADAKETYIRKQNEQLSALTAIYNNLEELAYHDMWVLAESQWRKLQRQDSNFGGLAIEISTKPNGIMCRLPICLYENGI